MLNNRTRWAATCTHTSGAVGVSEGTGMPAFALAAITVRKPAADARYDAQGDHRAWSPPV